MIALYIHVIQNIAGLWNVFRSFAEISISLLFVIFFVLIALNFRKLKKTFLENLDVLTLLILLSLIVVGGVLRFKGVHGCSQTGDCADKIVTSRLFLEKGKFWENADATSKYTTNHGVILISSLFFSIFDISYLLPAYVASALSTLNIFLVFFIGKIVRNKELGLIGATFFTFSSFLVIWSKDIELYSALITFLLLSILSFLIYFKKNNDPEIFALGVASAGFSLTIRIEALFFFLPLLIFLFSRWKRLKFSHLVLFTILLLSVPSVVGTVNFNYNIYISGNKVQSGQPPFEGLKYNSFNFIKMLFSNLNSPLVPVFFLLGLFTLLRHDFYHKFFFLLFIVPFFLLVSVLVIHQDYGVGGVSKVSRSLLSLQIPILFTTSFGFYELVGDAKRILDRRKVVFLLSLALLGVVLFAFHARIDSRSKTRNLEIIKYSKHLPQNCDIFTARPSIIQVYRNFDTVDIGDPGITKNSLVNTANRSECAILISDSFCRTKTPGRFAGYENCKIIKTYFNLEVVREFESENSIYRIKN